jgi:hypothetical protein
MRYAELRMLLGNASESASASAEFYPPSASFNEEGRDPVRPPATPSPSPARPVTPQISPPFGTVTVAAVAMTACGVTLALSMAIVGSMKRT